MAEDSSTKYLHPRVASDTHEEPELGISIRLPPENHDGRPAPVKHMSAPSYQSPIRHHQRTPSRSKEVKETLNARSHYGSDDGTSVHRINQYMVKQEIGRGSFGAVHFAVDQYGHEYAVKEFSKSRLRKRAQSNLLRKPNGGRQAAGLGFNSPMHRIASDKDGPGDAANNSLSLIKEEIAIMKKLNHNNLVSLIEVLDDPQEDSLYMVLEMCKKGVAMKVDLEVRAEPYDDETCRCWFRDMILGIEYLHAQGIIHRDIKPDNCLITNDNVLKIVDFGVSEMFEKRSEMATAKSAGSPAFMPPELCVAKHGQISGRAADIWSMGVTLYCLRYGHIPFEKGSMIELYESIRGDDFPVDEEQDANFVDLMKRILEKDPDKRISMEELRNHPWVTKNGTDPLLSAEENCADLVEPPTEAEMDHAITGNMAHLLAVMKAVKRFKKLAHDKRGQLMEGIFGRDSRLVTPPHALRPQSKSQDSHDRRPLDRILVTSGVHRPIDVNDNLEKLPSDMDQLAMCQSPEVEIAVETSFGRRSGETQAHYKQRLETLKNRPNFSPVTDEQREALGNRSRTLPLESRRKGQAHDPLEDTLYLDIGVDPELPEGHGDSEHPIVSESPPGVDGNIFEQAYGDELEKIQARRGVEEPSMYLNRRVEHREDFRSLANIKDAGRNAARSAAAKFGNLQTRSYTAGQDIGDAGRYAAKSAAYKFEDLYTRSTTARQDTGGAGKSSTRSAADKFAERSSPYFEAGKNAARSGSAYAADYLEPWKQAAKSTAKGLVARAQAKWSWDANDSSSKESEETESTDNKEELPVDSAAAEKEVPEPTLQKSDEVPPTATAEAEGQNEATSSATNTQPLKSAFKEHVT